MQLIQGSFEWPQAADGSKYSQDNGTGIIQVADQNPTGISFEGYFELPSNFGQMTDRLGSSALERFSCDMSEGYLGFTKIYLELPGWPKDIPQEPWRFELLYQQIDKWWGGTYTAGRLKGRVRCIITEVPDHFYIL